MVKLGKLVMTTEDFAMDVGSVAVTMFVFVSGGDLLNFHKRNPSPCICDYG